MPQVAPPFSMPDAMLFVGTVESGSFVAAARLHEVTPSAVSKAITRLETELGVQLLVRSTRTLRLTDEGALFFEKCREALGLMRDAAELATETSRSLRGTLRVGMPPPFAHAVGMPLLRGFLEAHPELTVEVVRLLDISGFYARRLDCAVVVGDVDDPTLAGRELGAGVMVMVAAPSYLSRRPAPRTVAELAAHDCIERVDQDGGTTPWMLRRPDGGTESVPHPAARLRVEETASAVAAALEGLGIAWVPLFQVSQALAAGRLVRVLPELDGEGGRAWIVHPARRALPRRVRLFVDHIVAASGALSMEGVRRPGGRR